MNNAVVNKNIHFEKVLGDVNIGESPEYRVSSVINELLNLLSEKPPGFNKNRRRPPSETIEKIEFNNLKSKRHIIKQYLDHSIKIEEAYGNIDSFVPFGKATIIQRLNDLYYCALDSVEIDYFKDVDIDAIRKHSDLIIDFLVRNIKNTAFESKNTPSYKEHVELGVNVIVAHAFVECVIMENPNS